MQILPPGKNMSEELLRGGQYVGKEFFCFSFCSTKFWEMPREMFRERILVRESISEKMRPPLKFGGKVGYVVLGKIKS